MTVLVGELFAGERRNAWLTDAVRVARRRAFEGIHRLARTHDLTSYDAAYLEVAVRYGIPVATLDVRLRKAVVVEGLSIFEG